MYHQPPPSVSPLRASLRVRVTLGVLLPLLLLLGGISIVQLIRHRKTVLENAALFSANASQVAEASLRYEIMSSHFEALQALLDAIDSTGEFRVLYLLNTQGKVIFAPGGVDVGVELSNQHPDCRVCHNLPAAERPSSVVVTVDGQRVFRSMVPMENSAGCVECHRDDGELLALLLTDAPMASLETSLRMDLWENLAWLAAMVVIAVVVVNLALRRMVLARIQTLTDALAGFGRGRHNLRLPVDEPDEIGQLAEAFNEMGQQVAQEEAANQALSEHLQQQSALRGELLSRLITAQEDERQRLAREIHDEVGQSLSGLALQLEVLQRRLPAEARAAREQVGRIQALVAAATDSMYSLIFDLRPAALDDLGLPAALRTLAERALSNTRINFEMNAEEYHGRLPAEMEIAIYRLFQEALSNVIRHASARKVRFTLRRLEDAFEGYVEDDGRGFRPQEIHHRVGQPRGLGLAGMRERVAQFGGELRVESDYGQGTRVFISIPLDV